MQLHIRQMKALQWNLDITSLCITKSPYGEQFSSPLAPVIVKYMKMNLYFMKPNFTSPLVLHNIEFLLNLGKCSQ